MTAHETERPSPFRTSPFIDPADRILDAFDHRGHDRPRFGEETELEVIFLAQVEVLPAAADRMPGVGLMHSGRLYQVSGKTIPFGRPGRSTGVPGQAAPRGELAMQG